MKYFVYLQTYSLVKNCFQKPFVSSSIWWWDLLGTAAVDVLNEKTDRTVKERADKRVPTISHQRLSVQVFHLKLCQCIYLLFCKRYTIKTTYFHCVKHLTSFTIN